MDLQSIDIPAWVLDFGFWILDTIAKGEASPTASAKAEATPTQCQRQGFRHEAEATPTPTVQVLDFGLGESERKAEYLNWGEGEVLANPSSLSEFGIAVFGRDVMR